MSEEEKVIARRYCLDYTNGNIQNKLIDVQKSSLDLAKRMSGGLALFRLEILPQLLNEIVNESQVYTFLLMRWHMCTEVHLNERIRMIQINEGLEIDDHCLFSPRVFWDKIDEYKLAD